MADLTGVSVSVTSDDGSVSHQLVIQSQTAQPDGSAMFTGTLDPANADGGMAVTGSLAYDAQGNIQLMFRCADGSSLGGTVTGQAGAYYLDAVLTSADASSAVHMAGDQDQPPARAPAPAALAVTDLTGVSFTMADQTGNIYNLAVNSEVDNGDGTASFVATWQGGETVNGTLSYDANGNLLIAFTTADGSSFAGTMTGQPGAYHLDALLTSADGSSVVHMVGDQDQPPA
jgi:hypothetical protein